MGDGRFKKGQSGNPTGKGKATEEFLAAVRAAAPKALENIQRIANDMEHPDHYKANLWIAERAHGKAPQSVDVQGDISLKVNLIKK